MQLYRDMDIGTAKPALTDRDEFGLLDLADPGDDFSAGDYQRAALPLIEQAWRDGRVPCLVGGSGLYIRALCQGLAQVPAVPQELRRDLEERLSRQGLATLAAELKAKDPATAEHTALDNPRRVLRALEVFEATGQGLAHWQSRGPRGAADYDRLLFVCLDPGKEELENRIGLRVQVSIKQGWLEETKNLANKYGRPSLLKTGAIGYGELIRHLDGEITLAQAQEMIALRTRQYARRQRTWFRKENPRLEISSGADLLTNHKFKEWTHAL